MQLRAYEALEEEVDETVLRAAGQPDLASTRDSMLQVVRGLPSSPERRVKQALQLVSNYDRIYNCCDGYALYIKFYEFLF